MAKEEISEGETSTPRCGPRARDDNSAHNTTISNESLRPLKHQGETHMLRCGPRKTGIAEKIEKPKTEVSQTARRDGHAEMRTKGNA
eukprot:2131306-Pleurochrysis_carterae.AAC.1